MLFKMFLWLVVPVMGFIGLITGANIGGNYFPDFQFLGLRGYEATGLIGLIVGLVAGFVVVRWVRG